MSFSVWLTSFSRMPTRFVCGAHGSELPKFLKLGKTPVCLSVCAISFIHSSVHGHLGCFLLSAIANNAMNLGVRIPCGDLAFCLQVCTQEWVAGSEGDFMFHFLRNHCTIFHSSCSFPCSPAVNKGSKFLQSHQHLFSGFWH